MKGLTADSKKKTKNEPEVGAAFSTLVFQTGRQRLHKRSKMSVFKRSPQLAV